MSSPCSKPACSPGPYVLPPGTTLYGYSVGYDGAGNVTALTNGTEMGTWGYTYDPLNRLSTATATAGPFSGLALTETYDSYGNRESQTAGWYSTQALLVWSTL